MDQGNSETGGRSSCGECAKSRPVGATTKWEGMGGGHSSSPLSALGSLECISCIEIWTTFNLKTSTIRNENKTSDLIVRNFTEVKQNPDCKIPFDRRCFFKIVSPKSAYVLNPYLNGQRILLFSCRDPSLRANEIGDVFMHATVMLAILYWRSARHASKVKLFCSPADGPKKTNMVSAYGLRRRSSREQSTFFLKIVKLLHNDSNPKMQSSYLLTRALVTRASAEITVRRENVIHARQSTDYHCSGAVHYALVTFPRGRRCWRVFW